MLLDINTIRVSKYYFTVEPRRAEFYPPVVPGTSTRFQLGAEFLGPQKFSIRIVVTKRARLVASSNFFYHDNSLVRNSMENQLLALNIFQDDKSNSFLFPINNGIDTNPLKFPWPDNVP